jgi:molybdopterin-guanine dinucleotide biosynthesis protein A
MFDAIVLAGGAASRLGGADKPDIDIGGASLLSRVLDAVAGARRVIVVGPQRAVSREVVWCREEPAGGGPVSAIAAGLAHVDVEVVVVLGADLPAVAPAVPVLLSVLATTGSDAAALADASGRVNYLAAAWHTAGLRRCLGMLDEVSGASMRSLVAHASLAEVPDADGWGTDCDTWDDIEAARRRTGEGSST